MTVVESIVSVWTSIMSAITSMLTDAQALFWNAETGLTFLGVLSVISVAIGVVLLIVSIIQNFLHFRG